MSLDNTVYLGDGLYATVTSERLELFSHNGFETLQRVFLGPREIDNLLDYLALIGVKRLNPTEERL